jgi:hypothetical protein
MLVFEPIILEKTGCYLHEDSAACERPSAVQDLKMEELYNFLALIIHRNRGIFVMECARMPFQKFFRRRMQARMAFRNLFFPGIDLLTPPPLQLNFGSLCVPQPIFFKK